MGDRIMCKTTGPSDGVFERKRRNLEEYAEFRSRLAGGESSFDLHHSPIEVFIEPTKHCNIKCRMCCHGDVYAAARLRKPEGPIHFSDTVMDRLVPLLDNAIMFYAVGVGEPLMHPELSTILSTADEHGAFSWINSNGMLINEDRARSLAAVRLGRLMFSISAGTRDTYERIHEGGSWDRFWQNFENYQIALSDEGFIGEVFVNFVAQTDNLHELPMLAEKLARRHVRGLSVKPIADIGGITAPVSYRRSYSPQEDDAILDRTRRILSSNGMSFETDTYTNAVRSDNIRDGICIHPFRTFYVNVFGDVYPCCFGDIFEPDRLKLGSLQRESAQDIWYGEKARVVRSMILERDYFSGCRKCIEGNLNALHNDINNDISEYRAQIADWHFRLSRTHSEAFAKKRELELKESGVSLPSLWSESLIPYWEKNNQISIDKGTFISSGNDPFLIGPTFRADPNEIRFVKICLSKLNLGIDSCQLFWMYEGDIDFQERQSIRMSYGHLVESKQFELYFDLSRSSAWDPQKSLIKIRIDPLEAPGAFILHEVKIYGF